MSPLLDAIAALPLALLLAPALLLLAAAAGWWWQRRRSGAAADALDTLVAWSPTVTRVLNAGELRAHALLVQALPQQIVLAQVSLARFIKVPTRNSYAEWLRRVGHLHADLLVCDERSQVLAVVEVRRAQARGGERLDRRRERFAKVMKAAGIPLHVWTEDALPSVEAVRRSILVPPARPGVTAPRPPSASEPGFDTTQLPALEDGVEVREAPPSTWFDDFDSAMAPLPEAGRPNPAPRKP